MVYGTPGGDQQDQWQTNFLIRHVAHGLNLQEAIDTPSFHNEHHPSSFTPRQASPGRLGLKAVFQTQPRRIFGSVATCLK